VVWTGLVWIQNRCKWRDFVSALMKDRTLHGNYRVAVKMMGSRAVLSSIELVS
jgi:hypothetical protein